MSKNVVEKGGGEIKGMADEMGLLNRMQSKKFKDGERAGTTNSSKKQENRIGIEESLQSYEKAGTTPKEYSGGLEVREENLKGNDDQSFNYKRGMTQDS